MSGPKAASKAGGGGSGISAADLKLINTVKEVVTKFSDEEIYAMLKECNRDPNDTAQRLLTQDNFHLVTRKRDRKKETASVKDAPEGRQSNNASYGRGGRSSGLSGSRGPGRGVTSARNEAAGGRGRAAAVKENGIPSVVKTSITPVGGGVSYSQLVQPKAAFDNAVKNLPSPVMLSNGESLQSTLTSTLDGGWPPSSGYSAPTALQGAWLGGSGHGTIADMLKGNSRKPASPHISTMGGEVISATVPDTSSLEQFPGPTLHIAAPESVINVQYDSRTRSPSSAMNCELGAGGLPRFAGDVSSCGLQDGESAHYASSSNTAVLPHERDAPYQSSGHNLTAALEEHVPSASGYQGHVVDLQDGQPASLGSQFSGGSTYHGLQYVENQKESSNVDWNSQLSTREEAPVLERSLLDGPCSPPSISTTAGKLQELNVRDSHSVIIPDHIRVSDAECTMLSFGSFDVGFDGLSSNPSLRPEVLSTNTGLRPEAETHSFSASESAAIIDLTPAVRPLSASMPPSAVPEHEQPISSIPAQNLLSHADVNESDEEADDKEEEEHAEAPAQRDFPPSYTVIDTVSSAHTSQYAAVPVDADSRPRDVSRVLPQYDNSTYYSEVFRSGPETLDSRYSAFSQLAASGKLTPSRPAETNGQSVSPEVVNASIYPNSNIVGGQTMAAVNNGPSAMSLPQHSMHAYASQPSGLPLGPFTNLMGYQYMPPGFSYVQSPYQHNYVGTSNYHQVPPALGAGGLKYTMPQYKTAGPMAGGMHSSMSPSSLGYGGYPNSQPAANLPATSANASNYDDAAPQHYKDNTVYIPNQQLDGPSIWLQNQLARDAQGSSFYNVPAQSQPARYSQTQSLLTHTHPAAVYGNLYHPQQSAGSSPSAHQLMQQQQQGLGSMGALGTQIGSFQQNQRAQPTWAPNPY